MVSEYYFMYINFLNSNLMVSISQVDLQKVLGSLQLIQEIVHPRDGISIPNGLFIKQLVVNTHPHVSILFLYQNYIGSKRALNWSI